MQQENNNPNPTPGRKVLPLVIYAIITIMTCSAVWNSRPGAFLSVVALATMAANGYVIYKEAKKIKEGK